MPRYLSRQQVRKVDQRAIDEYGMLGIVLMENAGRGCAEVLCQLGIDGTVVICCGKGNNGGDGFVMARHLELRGCDVKVLLWCEPHKLPADAAINHEILSHTAIPRVACAGRADPDWLATEIHGADWIVDALLGTGARGEPRPPLDRVIDQLNQANCKKLAVDIPSGLDCDTGAPANSTFRADHTCSFVAPKVGFLEETAKPCVGQIHVVDIGVPRRLLDDTLA